MAVTPNVDRSDEQSSLRPLRRVLSKGRLQRFLAALVVRMGFRIGITVVQNVHLVQDFGVLAALPQKTPQVYGGRTEL
tara:strand:+ start:844 stop:1077 length:234 start_codon:yes stop_codon:yes gene_type:complete